MVEQNNSTGEPSNLNEKHNSEDTSMQSEANTNQASQNPDVATD